MKLLGPVFNVVRLTGFNCLAAGTALNLPGVACFGGLLLASKWVWPGGGRV